MKATKDVTIQLTMNAADACMFLSLYDVIVARDIVEDGDAYVNDDVISNVVNVVEELRIVSYALAEQSTEAGMHRAALIWGAFDSTMADLYSWATKQVQTTSLDRGRFLNTLSTDEWNKFKHWVEGERHEQDS